jgi:hypothetical protein
MHLHTRGSNEIRWPATFEPSTEDAFAGAEIEIVRPAPVIWSQLVDAVKWPSWYPLVDGVSIGSMEPGPLHAGTVFRFRSLGVRVRAEVVEYAPVGAFGWTYSGGGLHGYQAWLIRPTGDGCTVVAENVEKGHLAAANRARLSDVMRDAQVLWLERLKARCETA